MAQGPRSTGAFISYDLRPAKQSERRILLDLLKIGGDIGLHLIKYRYVGMGANRFYDFLLIYKYLGIQNMVSLEHDDVMFKRAKFNCPYNFINVVNKNTAEFLDQDNSKKPTIYWFDYDGGLNVSVTEDILSMSTKMRLGDFSFVTLPAESDGIWRDMTATQRLDWFNQNLPLYSGELTREDVANANFVNSIRKVLLSAYAHSFATRQGGRFYPFLQIAYKDSMKMLTIGGAFLTDKQIDLMSEKIQASMPFLRVNESILYNIRPLNLTERERVLFDRAVTHRKTRCINRRKITEFGFTEAQISAYRDIIRYLPRYVETIV